MPEDNTTRWIVSVSKETDISVRSFLAQQGSQNGGLSEFIEEAVNWRLFDRTLAEVRGKFADLPAEELDTFTEEAVVSARQEAPAKVP